MDDLISRQAVIDLLKKSTSRDIEEVVVTEKNIKIIMDMPKAFDVDAVIEQFEKEKESSPCRNTRCKDCKYTNECYEGERCYKVAIDTLISIVKAGGING